MNYRYVSAGVLQSQGDAQQIIGRELDFKNAPIRITQVQLDKENGFRLYLLKTFALFLVGFFDSRRAEGSRVDDPASAT